MLVNIIKEDRAIGNRLPSVAQENEINRVSGDHRNDQLGENDCDYDSAATWLREHDWNSLV